VQHCASAGLRAGDGERDSLIDWPRALGRTCPFVVAGTGPVGVAGLIRSLTVQFALGVSHHSPAASFRTGTDHVPPAKE
jgi:hypothetical protein